MEQEPTRINGAKLFKRNLLDRTQLVTTTIIYLICLSISKESSIFSLAFILPFGLTCWLVNRCLESYKSFKRVNSCVKRLSANKRLLRAFLSVHVGSRFAIDRSVDTFRWTNKIIAFFWPQLSHIVHHELNEFLVQSRNFVHSDEGMKRLLFAVVRQLDANILAIERCQLGAKAPYIKNIRVFDEIKSKTLVYDLDLAYDGNMNMLFSCKYFGCCTTRLGLRDVFMHFKGRTIIGPIREDIPKVDKIKFTLLELPEFGYKGVALVELAELKLARRAINRLIEQYLLYPETVSVSIDDLLESLKKKPGPKADEVSGPLQVDDERTRDICTDTRCKTAGRHSNIDHLPWTTRFAARCILCTFLCSNCCLRCFTRDASSRRAN